MSPSRARTRLAVGAGAVIAQFALSGTPALATELPWPSHQIEAARATFLPFAAPPTQPVSVCIIDSGVDLNPDTQPVVVDREALDGGDPGDADPALHGTRMAMEAAAVPGNDWGQVGAAPSAVRIVSIRAASSTNGLSFNAYQQGMLACERRAQAYNIKVISLSVGFQGSPTPDERAELQDAVVRARSTYGLDVVAAAGNEAASQVSYPGAAPGILAVGATDAQRQPCAFSNSGPQLALSAPGCDLDEADPLTGAPEYNYAGTSQAAIITAAVLAAVRAYRPDLDASQAEQMLKSTAAAAGGVLDATSLFQAAGLSTIIASGQARQPPAQASTTIAPMAATPLAPRPVSLARPRVRIRRHGKNIIVRLLNLPHGDRATLTLLGPLHHGHRHLVRNLRSTRRVLSTRAAHARLLVVSYSAPPAAAHSASATYRIPR